MSKVYEPEYDEEYRKRIPEPHYQHDPWHLLGLLRSSHHCEGKKERIVAYMHTGESVWKCDCGHETGWV